MATRRKPAHNFVDMTGKTCGRLAVASFAEFRNRVAYWNCTCSCGGKAVVNGKYLRNGRTTSCGCFHRSLLGAASITHGMSRTVTYRTYRSVLSRCYNMNQLSFAKYGAKGVTVCARWRASFENFLEDMGERPAGKTLDRENPFGNYEPGNCRWLSHSGQMKNRRSDVAMAIIESLIASGHQSIVDAAFAQRYKHQSHSPAKAFEDWYTRIG